MRNLTSLLFVTAVLGIYFAMNWYVLGRLFTFASLRRGPTFYLLVIFMTASLIISIALRSQLSGPAAATIYEILISWLGVCFVMLWILAAAQLLSYFLKIPLNWQAVGAITASAAIIFYAGYNARNLKLSYLTIPSKINLRIAQITDVHIGSVGLPYLKQIVKTTNSLKPDVVLIVGDLFDTAKAPAAAAVKILDEINAPVYFTSGNHEMYVGYKKVAGLFHGSKIKWLRNETVDMGNWRLIGIDNSYSARLLGKVMEKLTPSTMPTVLMNHQPIGFDIASTAGVDLMLSGHTHYGQIMPFTFIVKLFYPHIAGLYEQHGSYLSVSTGAGIWGPRMRLGSSNEIVVLDLKKN